MRLDRLALGPAERALDALLAGPLPEALGRSLAEHHVIERVAAGMVDGDAADPNAAVEELTHRIVDSPEFKRALTEVLALPEVRTALTSQAAGFGDEVAGAVRGRSRALDKLLGTRARRLLGLNPAADAARFGGLATRGAGLVLDAALAELGYLVAAASVALVLGLAGELGANWLNGLLAAAGWLLAMAAYFVTFWSTTGQTPGMRALGVRVVAPSGMQPSVIRSLVRFVGLILAIIPLCAGFLPVLVDGRRRALQDFLSGTVVLDDEATDS
jgi:uncharacterized RDD family membrane protein YckC